MTLLYHRGNVTKFVSFRIHVWGVPQQSWCACTKVVPRGYHETYEIALLALQDDTNDHIVASSAMVRVTTHVVENPNDYDDVYPDPFAKYHVIEGGNDDYSEDSDFSSDAEDM
ncbi:unnamed protein product [Cochlearia groenlandica]